MLKKRIKKIINGEFRGVRLTPNGNNDNILVTKMIEFITSIVYAKRKLKENLK